MATKDAMRKLATFCAALAAAVFAAHYFLQGDVYLWFAIGSALLASISIFLSGEMRLRIILVCLGAAVGFAACAVSFAVKTEPCIENDGKTLEITALVTEYPKNYDDYSCVIISLRTDGLPRTKASVGFYDTQELTLRPGDIISFTAAVKYSGFRYDEPYDRLIADDIFLRCYPKSEVLVTGRQSNAFLYFPREIEKAIVETAQKVFPEESVGFMTALLTGNKDKLYEDLDNYNAMSRAGILHVVAVSGLHVAFLIGFLRLIVRKKKTASIIGIPLVWIFAAVAGFVPSIIRAAFMQSAVLISPLFKRENDSLTSLTAILAIMLIINPEACASVSLQLSFAAILGMIMLTGRMNTAMLRRLKKRRKKRAGETGLLLRTADRAVDAVIATFSASIGALALSTPIMAWHFGSFATYSILANVLIFWAVSAAFILGYLSCFAGMIWLPMGVFGGYAAGLLSEYISLVCRLCAALPFSLIFVSEGYFLFWLISIYAVFGLWFLLRRKRIREGGGFRPVLPVCLVISLLCIGVIITEVQARNAPASMTAVDVGQGQSLVISSGNSTAVIDCGGKGTATNAGDTVAAYLQQNGIRSIDALCITHFDEDHVNGLMRLMTQVKVKYLVLPPENPNDLDREEILEFARLKNVEICRISSNTKLNFGDIELMAYSPVSKTNPEMIYLCTVEQCDILVTGDAYADVEARLLLTQTLPDVDVFVAGHHGSKHSNSEALLQAITPETVIVSCGYNSYGHPSQEALERFEAAGAKVLRTDESGTVRISLERS